MKTKYMLVKGGKVQRINHAGRLVWPTFESRKDAAKFAKLSGSTASPAKIGSVEGETLEGHIELAIKDGCEAAITVLGWRGNEAIIGTIDFSGGR